ncbi:hypothetical protein AMTR_s00051p00082110 [Amborella trichopoda]|uniref:Uncharacterized protein n=1 Tax=Amborella trichopoda TaxID=13333 RepID=U5CTN8_AMBTC|nr:hypothetical protein AMTR_s00051p00082110 [Amborella trichopoda]
MKRGRLGASGSRELPDKLEDSVIILEQDEGLTTTNPTQGNQVDMVVEDEDILDISPLNVMSVSQKINQIHAMLCGSGSYG